MYKDRQGVCLMDPPTEIEKATIEAMAYCLIGLNKKPTGLKKYIPIILKKLVVHRMGK